MKYGYAQFEDAERWHSGKESIEATIADAIDALHGGEHLPVAVCEIAEPGIDYIYLAEEVCERASEQLFEEVGEVAETFEVDDEQKAELAELIRGFVSKHGLVSCWKAENGRMYAPGDPEYAAAIAASDSAEGGAA